MRKKIEKEKIIRNKKIYKMYVEGSYSCRELARMFKVSHPRILQIVKKIKNYDTNTSHNKQKTNSGKKRKK